MISACRFGRKFVLTSTLLSTGIFLSISTILSSGSIGITVCAVLGTCTSGLAFSVAYSFTKEIMPTVARTNALSFASSSARIGSMMSPLVAMLDVYSQVIYHFHGAHLCLVNNGTIIYRFFHLLFGGSRCFAPVQ